MFFPAVIRNQRIHHELTFTAAGSRTSQLTNLIHRAGSALNGLDNLGSFYVAANTDDHLENMVLGLCCR
jgi:hypothetical protein